MTFLKKIFFCFFLTQSAYSYSQSIPSLLKKLQTAKADTAKLNTLNLLTENYTNYKNDSAKLFNDLSLKLSAEKDLYNFDGIFNKASILRKERKSADAIKYSQEAYKLAKQTNHKQDQGAALQLLAHIYEQDQQYKTALEYALRSFEVRQLFKDTTDLISSLSTVGSIYKKSNHITEGLTYYLQAARLAEKTKNTDAQFSIYINLGTLYQQSKDVDKALELYHQALKINQVSKDENGMAICSFKIANIYATHELYDSAYAYYKKTLDIHYKRNDELGLIRSLNTMGGILSHYKKYDESISYLNKALELSKKYNDTIQQYINYHGIGSAYYAKKNYKEAIKNLLIAADLASKKSGYESCLTIYDKLSLAYSDVKDFKNAHKYQVLYNATKDSVANQNDIKKQTELKLAYEFDKIQEKQKEEALAKEIENNLKLENEKQQRNYLLALLLLACGVIIIAVRSYINKRKANFKLEKQKIEIEFQKKLVDEKNKEISDSINYAQHIQRACLPDNVDLKILFEDFFVLYKPRDVVSGDFYWAASIDNKVFIAVADSTGHGVPGAIMSMIGSILLNEIFYVKKTYSPELILKELNRVVKLTLKQQEHSGSQDGMDIALCVWDKNTNQLYYSGANRPLYIINELNELTEIKPTKLPIGGDTLLLQDYELNTIELQKDYQIIMSSDGFADQFGGEKFKKITTKAFKQKLIDIANYKGNERKNLLEDFFLKWKGTNGQTDDVLVFSFKV